MCFTCFNCEIEAWGSIEDDTCSQASTHRDNLLDFFRVIKPLLSFFGIDGTKILVFFLRWGVAGGSAVFYGFPVKGES